MDYDNTCLYVQLVRAAPALLLGIAVNYKIRHAKEVPGILQYIAETYVELLDNIVKDNMFRHWRKYANYILTIFMFIFFANISGLFAWCVRRRQYLYDADIGFSDLYSDSVQCH